LARKDGSTETNLLARLRKLLLLGKERRFIMSLSTLFELFIAILGVVSACYLIYAYVEFIGDMLHAEKHHLFHHNPPI